MSDKIKFSDLVAKIVEETGASKQLIRNLFKEVANLTKEGLADDGRVNLTGLGHFNLKWYEAREGINPQTGEPIEIPAQSKVKFKSEAGLRNYINRKYKHLRPEIIEDEIEPSVPIPGKQQESPATPETELPTKPPQQIQATEPISESAATPSEQKRKSRIMPGLLWLIAPLIVIVIIYLLWPTTKQPEKFAEGMNFSESIDEDVTDVIAEPQQFEEEPTPFAEDKSISKGIIENEIAATEKPQQPAVLAEDNRISKNVLVEAAEEPSQPLEEPTAVTIGTPGAKHWVRSGDKIWNLAENYYNEAYLWPNIYRVNLNEIKNPDDLMIGMDIKIPPLEGKVGNLTNNDIADIAAGYIQVYLIYRELGNDDAYYYLWVAKQYDVSKVFNQFNSKINKEDLEVVRFIEGESRIK